MEETKAGNIDLKAVFHRWAKDASRGSTMECTNTEKIEAESGQLCTYEGHHIKRYKFVYPADGGATCGGYFWCEDGSCIESWTPSKDHIANAVKEEPAEAQAE